MVVRSQCIEAVSVKPTLLTPKAILCCIVRQERIGVVRVVVVVASSRRCDVVHVVRVTCVRRAQEDITRRNYSE